MRFNIFGRQIEMKKEALIILVSVIALLCCLAGYIFFSDDNGIIIEEGQTALSTEANNISSEAADSALNVESSGGEASSDNEKTAEYIKVYVVGCVKSPGIVTIEKGQMLYDAVEKAGGLTEEADAESINMVYELNENVMVYIKPAEEVENPEEINDSNKAAAEVNAGNGALIVRDSGSSAILLGAGKAKAAGDSRAQPFLVNINTAGVDELDTLPGVGEATAKAIIDFREKNGPFLRIEDIMQVPRIKQGRFDSIKDFITVD